MQELDDNALLREYVERDSGAAFAALVTRHVNKVYSVALRHTGNTHQAEEITQAVFVVLARKSPHLSKAVILSGWLYQTARLTALTHIRSQIRRARREQEAYMQTIANDTQSDTWNQIAPLLDAAMAGLNETDRHAVVLRFFDGKSLREVGAVLGANEDAAKKRVTRALEKLRKFFLKRGVSSTVVVIAGAIAANSVQAAPAALANSATAAAITKGAAASGSILTLSKGALKLMAWTKAKTVIAVTAGIFLTTSVSTVAFVHVERVRAATENDWIKSITYFGDDKQKKLWRSRGERGIEALLRGLKSPDNDRARRMCIASVLSQLSSDKAAQSAVPALIDQVKVEKQDSVRAIELGCLDNGLTKMTKTQKAKLFPELVRGTASGDPSVRNNALEALQYYPEEKNIAVSLMVNALQDTEPLVRIMGIKALQKVDPQNPAQSDFVSILAKCLNGPYGLGPGAPNDAALMLGEMHKQPEIAVPALIQGLQNEQEYVRGNSASSLARFGYEAQTAVPALQRAVQDADGYVRKQAAAALERINSGAPPK